MASRVTSRRRRSGGKATAPPSDLLAHRCRTLTRRGKHRDAAKALRALVYRDQTAAAWVRLGAMLARCRRVDAAVDALKQGQWLHRQAGQRRRAAVVSTLIERVHAGQFPLAA